jgi:hypothetical protein
MGKQANSRTEEWENLNAKRDQEKDLASELRGQKKKNIILREGSDWPLDRLTPNREISNDPCSPQIQKSKP